MKYKKLIVSGCSFTENEGSWAYVLSSILGIELVNLAVSGLGNKHIQYSLMHYLSVNDIDPETTLIGIMWSHPIRQDIIVEYNPDFKDKTVYRYKFGEYAAETSLKDIIEYCSPSNIFTRIGVAKNKIISANDNKAGITLSNWTSMESTVSFLKYKGYNFFQTIFHDFLDESDLLKNVDERRQFERNYIYTKELDRVNLKLNKENWLEFEHTEYLGEYAYFNQVLSEDQYHPSKKGYAMWTLRVLIPALKKQGFINNVNVLPWLVSNNHIL
jgi:hypothetical protein